MRFTRVLFAMAVLAATATPVQAAELKIGVVNVAKLLSEAPQSKAASQRMEKEFSGRQRELMDLQKSAQDLEERLTRDSVTMSAQERQGKERELLAIKRDLKNKQEDFREDFEQRNREENERVQRTIVQAIDDFVKGENYDLILGEGVIRASKALDITERLMERLKKQSDVTPAK